MKQILIQRIKEVPNCIFKNRTETSTLGEVTIIDEENNILYKCYSVENGGPSTDKPNKDKRIVARDYQLKQRYTNVTLPAKYNKIGLWLINPTDSTFADRYIMFHIANGPQDVEGCIGFGTELSNTKGLVNNSKVAVTNLYDCILKYGIENFYVKIKEIPENSEENNE